METAAKLGLVFLGGGTGACLRFLLGGWIQTRADAGFPWGTLAVNLAGALLIGLVAEWLLLSRAGDAWRYLLAVGVLGGFTTFSTLSYESLALLESREYAAFAGYLLGTNVLGLGLCALGMWLMRRALGG